MGYTKVKAQKCLLKATNQTEPKGFTSIRPPGWFFSRAGDIYTQKTKINWKSYCHIGFVMGVFANGSKLW